MFDVPGFEGFPLMQFVASCDDSGLVPVDGMFGRQSMFSYGRGRSIISGKGPFVFFQSLCQGPFGLSNVGGGAIIAGYLIYHSSL